MPEPLTGEQLDNLMAELMFAEDLHRGNTGTPGKYGVAVIAIADLRERVAELEAALTKSEAVCDSAAAILSNPGKHGGVPQALAKAREVFGTQVNTTLAAVKRETAAQALEAVAHDWADKTWLDSLSHELLERAAALRSGTEAETGDN